MAAAVVLGPGAQVAALEREVLAEEQAAGEVHGEKRGALPNVGAGTRHDGIAGQHLAVGAFDAHAHVTDRLLLGAAVGTAIEANTVLVVVSPGDA